VDLGTVVRKDEELTTDLMTVSNSVVAYFVNKPIDFNFINVDNYQSAIDTY